MDNTGITKKLSALFGSISVEEFSCILNETELTEDKENALIRFGLKLIIKEVIQTLPTKSQEEKRREFACEYKLCAVDMEIVCLVAVGKTNEQISAELRLVHLSADAVHKRLSKIYKKTKTANRKELIRLAVESGIV